MESTIENEHDWFAGRIAANFCDGLSAAERARFEAHRRQCPSCAELAAEAAEMDGMLMGCFDPIRPPAGLLEEGIMAAIPTRRRRRMAIGFPKMNPKIAYAAAAVAATLVIAEVGYVAAPSLDGRQKSLAAVLARSVSNLRQIGLSSANSENNGIINTVAKAPTFQMDSPASAGTAFNGVKDQAVIVDGRLATLYASTPHPADYESSPISGATVGPGATNGLQLTKSGNGQLTLSGSNAYTGGTTLSAGTADVYRFADSDANRREDLSRKSTAGDAAAAGGSATPTASAGTYQYAGTTTSGFGVTGGLGGGGGGFGGGGGGRGGGGGGGGVSNADRTADLAWGGALYYRPGDLASAARDQNKDLPGELENKGLSPQLMNRADSIGGSAAASGQIVTDNGLAIHREPRADAAANPQAGQTEQHGLALAPAAPIAAAPTAAPAPAPSTPAPAPEAAPRRMVIRSGEISFEVDSFDSALVTITTIVGEEGGYVGTTDSQKMANGKVQGVITVRVPPDRLDTLILKLRALGDLKGQKIGAQDVTKQYTDLESELRAAKAMEERLLDIIKTGKGEVKDLLEAEKELGTWREKIEQVTGEINYYNNLVSLSTLQITLTEKDISTAASLMETETVNAGLESDDVTAARQAVLKAIDDAKGHVRQSDLKELEAGQFAATVVAEVPHDAAGPIVDRLRQLGRLARLDMNRQTVTNNGAPAVVNGAVTPGLFVQTSPTILNISIYNLANVAPRVTDNLNLACTDVETAYQAILDRVAKANGRIIGSNLNRPKPEQVSGSVSFEVRSADAAAVLADVRALGDVMRLAVTENPDAANVTSSKQGYVVQLFSWSSVAPRNIVEETMAATGSVADAFAAIQTAAAAAPARVISATQNGGDQNRGATVTLEVRRDALATLEQAITASGAVVSRKATQSTDTENTIDSKVELRLSIVDLNSIPAAETRSSMVAVADVTRSFQTIEAAVRAAGASVSEAQNDDRNPTTPRATLNFEVLRSKLAAVEKAIADAGSTLSATSQRAPDESNTVDVKVKLNLILVDAQRLRPRQETQLVVQTSDPEAADRDIEKAAGTAGARIVQADASRTPDGTIERHRVVSIVESAAPGLLDSIRREGSLVSESVTRDDTMPDSPVARVQIDVRFTTEHPLVGADDGVWAATKSALSTTIRGLLYSLQFLMIGLFLLGPWCLAIWLVVWLVRRNRRKAPPVAT